MDLRDSVVQMTMQAARSLLVISPSPPHDQGYREFEKKVREYNKKEPFNFPNNLNYIKHVTEHAAYLYDSVMLYAEALSNTLKEDEDPKNGTYIIQKIISKGRYKSVTGTWMHIDENGDVEGNYTVLALQRVPHNLTLKSMGVNFSHAMLPMGNFQLDDDTEDPIFNPLDISIDWVAPLEEPPCGFDGSGCKAPPDTLREIFAGILGLLFIGSCLTAWVCYKNWKYEQEIAGLLWRIPIADIQRFGPGGVVSSPSKMSVTSQMSLESKVTGQVFTETALYKGTIVATKSLKFLRKNIEIQRETKKEMKIMREMHHDNINQFIGACVQTNCIFIVTEYCAKGSLQDILENDDIKLDHMFIASLVFDLIKGMIFLHESDLKVHCNLKSSNCVVTSRWVLQVTDFGLRDFYNAATPDITFDYEYYKKLLWMAPELLRAEPGQLKGTQKGDVYAFAIVLHEIMLRLGPFGNCDLQPHEIVSRVKAGPEEGSNELFRPPLVEFIGQDYIRQTIVECWAEKPENRPSFRQIREKLLEMKQGMKSNIMDNMMAMMERYANNLEDLVDERTVQLVEEQKKTEALLHRMLPKSVAEQLMRGEAVIPESFDAVTIYFSDIVGFTEMSATSTPMEVVTFLNDLYTVFDSIIDHYDVYKVETIGDAYMVVSGLPIRNGQRHAAEIAGMALDLLDAVKSFRIRHKPVQALKLRIGMHTGPVVTGVVGLTMPRYCLFGDTVNTASRMESNGEALKIHISEQCRLILEKIGGYEIVPRGLVKMKGKGELETYWLEGYEINKEIKNYTKDVIPPTPLFPLRERRSPKIEYTRRGSMVPRCVDDIPNLNNGSIPGIPVFLRLAQDSPRVKRFSPWQQTRASSTVNKDVVDGMSSGQDVTANNNGDCEPVEDQCRIQVSKLPDSAAIDIHGRLTENPEENSNYSRKFSSVVTSARRHCSGGDYKNMSIEKKKNPLVAFDDTTKPLLPNSRDRRTEMVIPAQGPKQPSKRWRSCDEIEQPKVSLKDWLAGLFNSRQLPDTQDNAKRVGHNLSGGALLRPVKEIEKEESVV